MSKMDVFATHETVDLEEESLEREGNRLLSYASPYDTEGEGSLFMLAGSPVLALVLKRALVGTSRVGLGDRSEWLSSHSPSHWEESVSLGFSRDEDFANRRGDPVRLAER